DGVVEALNEAGQQYTRESLLRVISENCKSSGKDIANLVKADLKNFCGNLSQHDDQSLLIVKF
ncbi:MAG: SpoIIE family protein phosphatase, partial [Spirochaetales bacterium]|nr:SpoIIE family protein phosphatase [Spirochaetales bacterium]